MEDFAHKTQEIVRNVMRYEKQDESKSTSWKGNDCRGFEIVFDSVKNGIPITSGVIAHVLISIDGGFEVVLSTYIIKDNLRSIIDTTSIPNSSSLSAEVTSALSKLIVFVASTISLSHVLMLGITRDRVLSGLDTKSTAKLTASNRSIRATLISPEVDNTYWKKQLAKEFGSEKVQEATSTKQLYRKVYSKSKIDQKRHNRAEPMQQHNPLAAENRVDLRDLGFPPRFPRGIDPDVEIMPGGRFDPLNPIRDPRQPPGGNLIDPWNNPGVPRNPLGGGLGGNPDLDPFGDPLNREIFGPPRGGGGFQGNPYMRGGGGGFI